MKQDGLFIPALVLCLIALVVTGMLALTYNLTRDAIERQSAEQEGSNREQLFPEGDRFILFDLGESGLESEYVSESYLVIADDDQLIGSLFIASYRGYGGDVPVMLAVDLEGQIIGARVLPNNETPNFGTKIEEPEFIDQFAGVGLDNQFVLRAPEDGQHRIDSVTAATESSRAVVEAINAISEIYFDLDIEAIYDAADLDAEMEVNDNG